MERKISLIFWLSSCSSRFLWSFLRITVICFGNSRTSTRQYAQVAWSTVTRSRACIVRSEKLRQSASRYLRRTRTVPLGDLAHYVTREDVRKHGLGIASTGIHREWAVKSEFIATFRFGNDFWRLGSITIARLSTNTCECSGTSVIDFWQAMHSWLEIIYYII